MTMLGTKWPSMMSMCSQSAPESIMRWHSQLRLPRSEASTDGAILVAGMVWEGDEGV